MVPSSSGPARCGPSPPPTHPNGCETQGGSAPHGRNPAERRGSPSLPGRGLHDRPLGERQTCPGDRRETLACTPKALAGLFTRLLLLFVVAVAQSRLRKAAA